jgi:glycine/D-amino acid oxidase-like deaminating enzyme
MPVAEEIPYINAMADLMILGAGLAGCSLAWAARAAGVNVTLVDRGGESASRVAAGLVTPVTGQRLVKTLQHDRLIPAALSFYSRVESETSTRLVIPQPIVRIFRTDKERTVFAQRQHADFEGLVRTPEPPLDPDEFDTQPGGFEMPTAWRLDVPAFLDVTRAAFASQFLTQDVDVHAEVWKSPTTTTVVCFGFESWRVPGVEHVPHNHAKGEVLSVNIPGLRETRIVNRGTWLAPTGQGQGVVGATYEWEDFSPSPTAAKRAELEAGLKTFVKRPYEVTAHRAANRAITQDRMPILGAIGPNRFVFSGLGSKGVLWAPYYANHLLGHLLDGEPLEPGVDILRWGRRA